MRGVRALMPILLAAVFVVGGPLRALHRAQAVGRRDPRRSEGRRRRSCGLDRLRSKAL
jgi:hypothetical protein